MTGGGERRRNIRRLETDRLAEALRRLVEEENLRLEARWRLALERLGRSYGPWAAVALAGRQPPRLSRLLVTLPCCGPKEGAAGEGRAPGAVRLGRPGFWQRLLGRRRPLRLRFEIQLEAEGWSSQVRLLEGDDD